MAEDEPATSATNTNPVTSFRTWFALYEIGFLLSAIWIGSAPWSI
jgi:hypothetical protein